MKNNPKFHLTDHEFQEMREYSRSELVELFRLALEKQVLDGFLSHDEAVRRLNEVERWINENIME